MYVILHGSTSATAILEDSTEDVGDGVDFELFCNFGIS